MVGQLKKLLKERGFFETMVVIAINLYIRIFSFLICMIYNLRGYDIAYTSVFAGNIYFRRSLKHSIKIDEKCYFADNFKIHCFNKGKVQIGRNVLINENCLIHSGERVNIGNDCLIGPYCYISDINHVFTNILTPINLQGLKTKPITIEENVWIGAHVTILQGVTIGKGSIVGAGAVVTKNIQPYTVVVGIPAKPIKKRM